MMTVAQEVKGPIKIQIPVDSTLKTFSILGLGDIIIPGMLCSLCIRLDLIRSFLYCQKKAKEENVHDEEGFDKLMLQNYSPAYFYASIFGYIVGLGITMLVVKATMLPQPALLYICPAMLAIVCFYAFGRQELGWFISYNEDKELERITQEGKVQQD